MPEKRGDTKDMGRRLATCAMIQGPQRAGANPTHTSVCKARRAIASYNNGGLLPTDIDHSTGLGHLPPTVGRGFLPSAPQAFLTAAQPPIGGHVIAGTATSACPS